MSEYSTRDRSKLFKSGLVDTPDIQDAAVTVDKLAPDVATYIDDLATDSISVANTGSAGQPQLSYDSGTGVISLSGSEVEDATKEPMGHADKTQSTISFNESTRTFTISPVGASFEVWCAGIKYTFTTAQSVQIPNTTGIYYIYFNAGVLGYKTTFFTWEADAPTAYVYWNATTGTAPFFADERHGITLDHATHEYLHRTRGAAIASGFSASNYVLAGDGSSNTHAQLDIAGGTFFDEDLQVDIVHSNTPTANTWQQDLAGPAKIPMFYLSGTSWVRDTATDFPLKMSNSLPGYNHYNGSAWSVAEVSDGKYATTWIIATNNLNYPIIALMGQSAADNSGQAEEKQFSDLVLTGFPVVEFRPLYKLIFRVNALYTNSVKAALASIWDLRQVSSTAPSSYIASDHGNLSGLGDDDHLQYVHVSEARSISANHTFSGSVNFTGSVNLPNSGVTAGSYGSASQVPVITVNADGLVTSASIVNVAGVTDFDYNTSTGVLDIDTADGGNFSTTVTLQPFTTTNLAEGANLYWTTARGQSMFDTRLATKTTDNVSEGVTNLYYTSARANADFDTRLATKSTTDVAEGANLYYTDARFDARLAVKTTDDLAEGSTNQYWTTARGESMFDSRLATKTTTDLAEGINLYYTDTRARAAISVDGGLLTYNTGSVGLSSETIQDVVGAMVSTNTESGISVTYNDVGNVIDFAVDTATIATKAYVDSTIQAVIDAAPAALDTLNELAAAINDDANYAGTVTALLATKVDKTTQVIAGTGMTGGGALSTNVTISHADTSSVANLTAGSRTYVTALSFDGFGHVTSYSTGTETVVDTNTTYVLDLIDGADSYTKNVRLVGSDGTIDTVSIAVGAVDTVYGLTIAQASDKITISHANTSAVANVTAATNTFISGITFDTYGHVQTVTTGAPSGFASSTHYHDRIYNGASGSSSYLALSSTNELEYYNASGGIDTLYLQYSGTASQLRGPAGAQIWMDSNDGSGSGLDADLLDGQHGSYYAPATGGNYVAKSGDTVSGTLTMSSATPLTFTSTATTVLDKNDSGTNVAYYLRKSGSSLSDGTTFGVLNIQRWNHTNTATTAGASIFFELKDSGGTTREYAGITGRKTEAGAAGGQLDFHNYGRNVVAWTNASELTHSSSVRAPIFYDSNNTGYYVDPNNTGTSGVFAGQLVVGDGIRTATSGFASPYNLFALSDTYDGATYYGIKYVEGSPDTIQVIGANNVGLSIGMDSGDTIASHSLRAPIFYDSNDTAKYIDPNSSSNINLLTLYGHDNQLKINTYAGGAAGWFAQENGANKWETYHYSGQYRFYNYTTGAQEAFFDNASGYFQVRTSVRAPIFYDSDDTAYYVDARSASVLSGLKLNGIDNNASGNDFILWINKPNNNDWGVSITGQYDYNYRYDGAASHSYGVQGLAAGGEYWRVGTDLLYHNSNIRAPIFYDNNNTGYYADPASGSNFNTVSAYSYQGNGNVGGTGSASWHPSGIYSGSTQWLYGTTYRNSSWTYDQGKILMTQSSSSRDNGIVGAYDPTRLAAIWAMGSSYQITSSGTPGSLYGLCYSYNPDYGAAGNNSGAISGLNHQMQWRANGSTQTAIGSGIWTTGNVTAYSDRRVKTNIERIPEALSKVLKLNGYTYERTDQPTKGPMGEDLPVVRQTGVIAQEVLEVLPEAVIGSEELHYSVAYGNMVGLLIEAIKEQQTTIESQASEIQELKSMINMLVDKVNKLLD